MLLVQGPSFLKSLLFSPVALSCFSSRCCVSAAAPPRGPQSAADEPDKSKKAAGQVAPGSTFPYTKYLVCYTNKYKDGSSCVLAMYNDSASTVAQCNPSTKLAEPVPGLRLGYHSPSGCDSVALARERERESSNGKKG